MREKNPAKVQEQKRIIEKRRERASKILQVAPTELLTLEEAAKLLGVSRNTIYKWRQAGEIKGYGIGQKFKFCKRSEVIACFESV